MNYSEKNMTQGGKLVMEVTIRLTKAFAMRFTENNKVIALKLEGKHSLVSLIDELGKKYPGFQTALQGKDGKIVDGINIYVNGENVRYLKALNEPLKEGDVINIIPAVAAG